MIRIVLIGEMVMKGEDKAGRNEARTRSKKSEKHPFNLCIQRLDHFDDAHYLTLFNSCFTTKLETGKIISLYNVYSPHDLLVYPPKIYFPTLIIVTVGALPSHRE